MKDRAAAFRYARALESALDGDSRIAATADQLTLVAQIMASEPVVAGALTNPGLDASRKLGLIDSLARAASLSKETTGFLRLLAEHGRFHLLPAAAEAFAAIRDKRLGIVQAVVTTASPLSPDLAEKTRQALETKTGRTIRLSMKTDPSLIGGMIAKVGSTVYDGSVRARLAALRGHIAKS